MSRSNPQSSVPSRRRRRHRPLNLEALECRALLDGAPLSVVAYDLVNQTEVRVPLARTAGPLAVSGQAGGLGQIVEAATSELDFVVADSPAAPDPGQIVFSPDTRSKVISTKTFPNSAIGRLFINWLDNSAGWCSGAMIDSYHFLTAGHCVVSWESFNPMTSLPPLGSGALTVSLGQMGDCLGTCFDSPRSEDQPWGQANVTFVRTYDAWTDEGDYDYDIALLTLDRRIGNSTGAFFFGYNTDDDFYEGTTAYTGGYPGDLNLGSGAKADMYGASGTISAASTYILESLTLDSFDGQSGSPIYFFNNQGERVVHAVLSGSTSPAVGSDYNRFTRIRPEVFNDIEDWIAWDDANAQPLDRADLVDSNFWFQTKLGYAAPDSAQAGDMILAATAVANMGTAHSGAFEVEFRLSNDDTFDTTDILLGRVSVGSLAPFDDATVPFAAYVPSGTPAGNYSVVWMIDPDDDVNEFNELNNSGDGGTLVQILPPQTQLLDRSISVAPGLSDDHANSPGGATGITLTMPSKTYGQIQYAADVDYFQFAAIAGATYHFEIEPLKDATTQLLPLADSTLTLYDTDGTTQLAFNNNAHAGVKWSRIVWTAPADGTYFVKVSRAASTPLGRYNLKAEIKDDHGSGVNGATDVDVSSDTAGAIEQWGDGDTFAFKTYVGGEYTIQTSLGTLPDSRLWLFGPSDEGGQFNPVAELGFNDDIGLLGCAPPVPCNLASKIVFTAEWADTYYAQVGGGDVYDTGSYELHVTVDDDHGDSKAQALELPYKIGFGGQPLPLDASGELEDPGDVDWFEFTATQGVTYTIETTLAPQRIDNTLADSTLTLFGANGTTQLAFNDDYNGPASRIVWTAPALGKYYVQVAAPGDQTGAYDLKISFDDDYSAALGGGGRSGPMDEDHFIDGSLATDFDSDSFEIWAIAGAKYLVELIPVTLADTTLTLYDSDGRTQLAFNDDAPGMGRGSLIEWTAPRNDRYYLQVGSPPRTAPGSYMIRTRVDDVGNDPGTARRVATPYFGDGKLEQAGDADWYSLAAVAGQNIVLRTYLGGLADSTLTLYEVDPLTGAPREIAFSDNLDRTDLASLIEWTAARDGLYYVRVGSAGDRFDGSYTLVVGNPDEHGDDSAVAARVTTDSNTPGVIGLVGDADWFSFPVIAGRTYTLEVDRGSLPAATLVLYDRDGRTPLDSAEANVEITSEIVWTAPADGIYFAKVAGEQNRVLGTYSLDVSPGVENTPPRVTGVALGSTGWTHRFRDHMTFGLPDSFGYAIPSGPDAQLDPLPWTNLDQIRIRLNERTVVRQDSLSLADTQGTDYSSQIVGFIYDAVTSEATWTLAAPLASNTYVATLSDNVTDTLGMPLDGEWIDSVSEYPSGNGAPGGSFRFLFDLAHGDVDRNGAVDRSDLRMNLDAQFSAIGSANYTVFGDLDGDGAINILDWSRIRDRLPTVAPSAAAPDAVVTDTTVPSAPTTLRAAAVDRAMVDRHSASADRPKNRLSAGRTRAAKSCRTDYRSEIALPREFSSISSLSSRASQPIACMTRSRG